MIITDESVEKLAAMTNLTISQEDKVKLLDELAKILDYVECLNDVDTDGVEPTSHILPMSNVFREDIVENEECRKQLLSNAPQQKNGNFVVPKTVD